MPAIVITIVMPPVGILLVILAALPAYYPTAKGLAWELRDQAVDEDSIGEHPPRPWE